MNDNKFKINDIYTYTSASGINSKIEVAIYKLNDKEVQFIDLEDNKKFTHTISFVEKFMIKKSEKQYNYEIEEKLSYKEDTNYICTRSVSSFFEGATYLSSSNYSVIGSDNEEYNFSSDFNLYFKELDVVIKNITTNKLEQVVDVNDSSNNGGDTDYYKLTSAPFKINDADDMAEWRKMNGFQFNILKVAWTFNLGRHAGTDELRDINKVIHYANREKQRILRSMKNKEK